MAEPHTREAVEKQIREAFDGIERPGNYALRGSNEGNEPYLTEQEFAEKEDWRTIDAEFLDQAPDGYGSALSFLSDEAFRYFLPAYLLADLAAKLVRVTPVFHLYHGLDSTNRDKKLNPRRFGDRTWFDCMRHKFSVFRPREIAAIVAYLEYKEGHSDFDFERASIRQALENYWRPRLSGEL